MEQSILTSTKKVLGISEEYTVFDPDVMTFINSTFSVLCQLGVGPLEGFAIEDDAAVWADLGLAVNMLGLVKSYTFLKVKLLFDPPPTSFHIDAMKNQILEHEVRISNFREDAIPLPVVPEEVHTSWW